MDIFQQNAIERDIDYIRERYNADDNLVVTVTDSRLTDCVEILLKIAIEQEHRIDELQTKLKQPDRNIWDHLH